jgi:hypothetical protein
VAGSASRPHVRDLGYGLAKRYPGRKLE